MTSTKPKITKQERNLVISTKPKITTQERNLVTSTRPKNTEIQERNLGVENRAKTEKGGTRDADTGQPSRQVFPQ